MSADPRPLDSPLPSAAARLLDSNFLPCAALLYICVVIGNIQLQPAVNPVGDAKGYALIERDGYLHARFANLLPTIGLTREFQWTQASTWRDRFCDKEFLYHVLMVPFATDKEEPIRGVLYYSLLLFCAIFAIIYVVLRLHGARAPLLFAILPLCMGAPFILRALMVRSHVLSISLLLISMHFLLRKHWKALFIIGFIYSWTYTVPMLLVMTAVPFVAGRWLAGGGLDWRVVLSSGFGVVLGLLIHPYSPYTLDIFLAVIKIMSFGATGVNATLEVGKELYPVPFLAFCTRQPGYCAVILATIVAIAAFRKKITPEAAGAAAASFFWLGMSLLFNRFIEYGVPLAALALGFVMREVLQGVDLRATLLAQRRALTAVAGIALAAGLSAGHASTMLTLYDETVLRQPPIPPPLFRGASRWMEKNLRPGETVVHLWWDEFPELFYDGYRQNFLWGSDPTHTLRFDANIAQRLENMRLKREPVDRDWLAKTFNARILIMGHATAQTFLQFGSAEWKPLYVDPYAVIFPLTADRFETRN